jgi:IS6 family transposase
VAVRWYLRDGLPYRDVEELLAEPGVELDHVTVYRWVQRFSPLLADAARFTRHSPGDRWVDETYVDVNGVWRYVYRAVDQRGQIIDVLVSARRDRDGAPPVLPPGACQRDGAAVRGCHRQGTRLPASPRRTAARGAAPRRAVRNNRIEADHSQLKHRLRPMRGLRTDRTAAIIIAGLHSCRIFDAAITNSESRPCGTCGSPPRSPNCPSDLSRSGFGPNRPTVS